VSINLRPVVRRAAASGLAVLGASLAMGVGDAVASTTGGISAKEAAKAADLSRSGVMALQRALGTTADGIYGPQTKRAVKRFQRSKGLVVDGIAGPQTLRALGLNATALESRRTFPRKLAAILDKIAACESGGDPTAVSPDGRYRGKYQFSRATWRGLGGEGDPAKAPERLQDRMAAKLYRQSGASPWPNCA
jgi:hypothetical protein